MVSSKDVALLAGVSQTTVSRVLNTPEQVSEATRKRVQRAIDQLNYIPNANARSLVKNQSQTISLISGPLHNPFYVDSTSAIVNYANEAGYQVNVHFVHDSNVAPTYENALLNNPDGLIFSCMLFHDPIVQKLEKIGLPYISFNRRHRNIGSYVEIDNFQAGYLALMHMFEYGHRQILWLGAAQTVSTFRFRYDGFEAAKQHLLYQYPNNTLKINNINYDKLDMPDIHATLLDYHKKGQMPSAICAATDAMAIQTINALVELGYQVPNDVSVIGIDNVSMSQTQLIQLTTIGCDKKTNLGLIAIAKLIEMIKGKQTHANFAPTTITRPVQIYSRKTTKPHS